MSDGIKYDSDGYPDLMPEPTITIPRAQYEALMAAKDELVRWQRDWYDGRCQCEDCRKRLDILAALRAAGIEIEG